MTIRDARRLTAEAPKFPSSGQGTDPLPNLPARPTLPARQAYRKRSDGQYTGGELPYARLSANIFNIRDDVTIYFRLPTNYV